MPATITILRTLAGLVALTLPLGACSVDVDQTPSGEHSTVDIRTPAGSLSVNTDVDVREAGLPPYPGARLVRRGDDVESANVNIATPWFGLKVIAAEFEADDEPGQVLEFYRKALQAYGPVTECRGEVDFRGDKPVCKENASADEIQLVTGTEEHQRVVVVKSRGRGSEFALVQVETQGT